MISQPVVERKRVLLTVKAYPQPSRSYDELVCTAGVLEDGSWIRIYPVPFQFLISSKIKKYDWIDLDLKRNDKDFRPESFRPNRIHWLILRKLATLTLAARGKSGSDSVARMSTTQSGV